MLRKVIDELKEYQNKLEETLPNWGLSQRQNSEFVMTIIIHEKQKQASNSVKKESKQLL
ncbi:MAG: hypothetical protein ACYT04_66770 [Nostoc sp.]